jgi:hypothetical protein
LASSSMSVSSLPSNSSIVIVPYPLHELSQAQA